MEPLVCRGDSLRGEGRGRRGDIGRTGRLRPLLRLLNSYPYPTRYP